MSPAAININLNLRLDNGHCNDWNFWLQSQLQRQRPRMAMSSNGNEQAAHTFNPNQRAPRLQALRGAGPAGGPPNTAAQRGLRAAGAAEAGPAAASPPASGCAASPARPGPQPLSGPLLERGRVMLFLEQSPRCYRLAAAPGPLHDVSGQQLSTPSPAPKHT